MTGGADHAEQAAGTQVFVDDLADGQAGNGTVGNPYRDLQVALDRAPSGATVVIRPGRYRAVPVAYVDPTCGNCSDAEYATAVNVTRGFLVKDKTLHLRGDGVGTVLETNAGYGLLFERAGNSSVRHLTVTGGRRNPDDRGTYAGVVVRDTALTLTAVRVSDNRDPSNVGIAGICGVVGREGTSLVIRESRIENNSWDGVVLYRGVPGQPQTAPRAWLFDNTIGCAAGATCNGSGFVEGVGIAATRGGEITAIRNVVHHYWKGIGAMAGSRMVLENNVVRNCLGWGIEASGGSTIEAWNNVAAHNGTSGMAVFSPTVRGGFVNNLVFGNGWRDREWVARWTGVWLNVAPQHFRFAHNSVFGNLHRQVCRGFACVEEPYHGVDGNLATPVSVDPVTFLPAPGSALLNAGDPGRLDQNQSRSDIGRFGGPNARIAVESITAYGKAFNFPVDTGSAVSDGSGFDLAMVSRYASGPCRFAPSSPDGCVFDTRTELTLQDGRRVESITAYGRFFNFDIDDGFRAWNSNGNDLGSVARYASGPCLNKPAGTCRFDSRTVVRFSGETLVESITAYGKYFNFDLVTGAPLPGNGSDLTSVNRYAAGPCLGSAAGTCAFDARGMVLQNDRLVESIIARGRYFNYDATANHQALPGSGSTLTSVARYASGPCVGRSADACQFQTRAFMFLMPGIH